MEALRHVLVATDLSPASERALDTAAELAGRFGSTLTVLHVISPLSATEGASDARIPAATRMRLDRTLLNLKRRCRAGTPLVRVGDPGREIVRLAEELGAELVVLGSHARKGLAHAVLGSVAEEVVRVSKVPVLTVPGYWFADRADAGAALADAVAANPMHAPVVVAITSDAVPVAWAVAERLHAPLELLLTRALVRGSAPFGAVTEAGELRIDGREVLPADELEMLVRIAREAVGRAADRFHETPWNPDLWRRSVVLVSDALTEPWTALVAADAACSRGAGVIRFAAPVGSLEALEALRRELPDPIVIHQLPPGRPVESAYREFDQVSARLVSAKLTTPTARVA